MVVGEDAIQSDTPEKKAVASLLIIKAKTIDEARKLIESDIYYTSGVVSWYNYPFTAGLLCLQWDSERITILPFIPATPFP